MVYARYLHNSRPRITHCDLKPKNVMLKYGAAGQISVRIIDFGLAAVKESTVAQSNDPRIKANTGTLSYQAPELFLAKANRNHLVDQYVFAVTVVELYAVQPPYDLHTNNAKDIEHLVCAGQRPPIPKALPAALMPLIKACWEGQAKPRPEFTAVVASLHVVFGLVRPLVLAGVVKEEAVQVPKAPVMIAQVITVKKPETPPSVVDYTATSGCRTSSDTLSSTAPLPPGWEACLDPRTGRQYFQNHKSQTTTWDDPRLCVKGATAVANSVALPKGQYPGAVFIVQRAGTDVANGYYKQVGERNGKPEYLKISAGGAILEKDEKVAINYGQNGYTGRGVWYLNPHLTGFNSYCHTDENAATPPTSGWKIFNFGEAPVPTITYI